MSRSTVNPSRATRRQLLRSLASLTALGSFAACGGGGNNGAQSASAALDAALALPVLQDADTSPSSGVFFGVFREAALSDVVNNASADLRRRPAAAMWFTRFGQAFPFPGQLVQYLAGQGMVAQITWEPWGAHDEPIALAAIVAGQWDSYIDSWGAAAAALDLPLMLRFGHEFNGNWYPWSLSANGQAGAGAIYAAAFRRVVTRMRAAGASKVQFVWCYNNQSTPTQSWNDPTTAYPGDDVVDWIGIDGYNFGTSQSWSRWTRFSDVFAQAVSLAGQIAPHKPVILAEMGCSETGGDKAAWITQMAADLTHMPSVRAITWFDTLKETSWQLTSSDASWLAAIEALHQPQFRSNAAALLAVAAASI